jgi:hypothetical protein
VILPGRPLAGGRNPCRREALAHHDGRPNPLPTLHPMMGFNQSEPAILHDCATDQIITWTGDQADDFRHSSRARDDGTIAWREYVFDGWGNVLGG